MICKVLSEDLEGEEKYYDFFFNEETINGYYITDFNKIDESVNVLIGQETMTLKQNEDLILYLLTKFNKYLSKNYVLGIISSGIGVKQWEKLYRLELDHFFDINNVFITDTIKKDKTQDRSNARNAK